MKTCTMCRQEKPYEAFLRDARKRDGLQSQCRTCGAQACREYQRRNQEKIKASKAARYAFKKEEILNQKAQYYRKNVGRLKVYKKAYQRANLDKAAASNRRYSAANLDKGAARRARYRASQLRATPAWVDLDEIEKYYSAARFLSMVTGKWHEVDHIVPLQSKFVCGLHVENNLRVIPDRENRSKGNRYWPDMP